MISHATFVRTQYIKIAIPSTPPKPTAASQRKLGPPSREWIPEDGEELPPELGLLPDELLGLGLLSGELLELALLPEELLVVGLLP